MEPSATERKLAAIMIADVVGFSRLMERDESMTFERVRQMREEVFQRQIEDHGGRIVKGTGDGFLAEFASANAALRAGIAIQRDVIGREEKQVEDNRIRLRIGINLGDVILDGEDVAGDGVNIASRLESLSPTDGICISAAVRDPIRDDLGVAFEDLGEQKLKNISRPIHAYAVKLTTKTSALAAFSATAPVRGFGGKPAIAVLPFDNMSNDPDQVFFADGIAEDILTRLAMWRWMPVIGRNSSFVYRGRSVDLKKAGAELGARYILEGSVRKAGDRVRVTTQLIDTDTGHHVWAQRYDRVLDDIFALQDEITEAIVVALEPAVGHAERSRAIRKGSQSLDAWELYQRGAWHNFHFTKESYTEARRLYLAAAELDRQFATPLALAALTQLIAAVFSWMDSAESMREAHRMALEAQQRDPRDSNALGVLGIVSTMMGHHDQAMEYGDQAVNFNPSCAMGYYAKGLTCLLIGEPGRGVASLEPAIRLSPNDVILPTYIGTLSANHCLQGEYEKAVEVALYGVQRTPHYPLVYRNLANALGLLGRIEEGRAALEKFMELAPSYTTETIRRTLPFRHETDFEKYMVGLRKLGWDK